MNAFARAALTAIGLIAVLALTLVVFRLPLVDSLRLIVQGAFGDKFGIARTVVKTIPLLLTGLGIVVAWRGGMFNIGGEGQFLVGALLSCVLAKFAMQASAPAGLITVGMLLASMVGGAAWSWISAWLYVRRGVEVVISTILLNFIALQLLGWAVSGPLQQAKGQLPMSDLLPSALMLPRFDRQTDLHGGLFVALFAAAVVWVFLYQTKGGFEIRVVGDSPTAARANLIHANRVQIRAMLVSGALCGLAGGVEYVGVAGQLGSGFSQNWGFLGIPVALLGGLHPLLVPLSATYFGALFAGSENLARFTQAGTTLIYVIQAAAVLAFVSFRALAERKPLVTEAN
ncbi:MAG: ABC transporter permease [Fimbriimonas sp.]